MKIRRRLVITVSLTPADIAAIARERAGVPYGAPVRLRLVDGDGSVDFDAAIEATIERPEKTS